MAIVKSHRLGSRILMLFVGWVSLASAALFTGTESMVTVIGRGGIGDGGPAARARLAGPSGIAVDVAGILYIADTGNQRIRTIGLDGKAATIAGQGQAGFAGDEGPGTAALFNRPTAVAVHPSGLVYIADTGNHRIRRLDQNGTIHTVAGNGAAGYGGDAGAAANAMLDSPGGLAVDAAGNLYIADTGNHRIRKVDAQGTITTLAGTGEIGSAGDGAAAVLAQLDTPMGLALGIDGDLLIADRSRWYSDPPCGGTVCYIKTSSRIRRIDKNGVISSVAGVDCETLHFLFTELDLTECTTGDGGPATQATFRAPVAVAVDAAGKIYIADQESHRVRRINLDGTVTLIAGGNYCSYFDQGLPTQQHGCFSGDGEAGTLARLSRPSSLAVDATGSVYVADTGNNRIRNIDPSGVITTRAGGDIGDGGSAKEADLAQPADVAVDAVGRVVVADSGHGRIRRMDLDQTIATIAGNGSGAAYSGDGGNAVAAALNRPVSLAFDNHGSLYLAEPELHRVRKVEANGLISTAAGGVLCFLTRGIYRPCPPEDGLNRLLSLDTPSGVEVAPGGDLLIAESGVQRIRKLDGTGTLLSTLAVEPDADAARPTAVVSDAQGNLYIADTANHRIQRLAAGTRILSNFAGGGTPADGLGDGGTATAAALQEPSDVAIDGEGNLFIADRGHRRIRQVDSNGIISTIAGTGQAQDTVSDNAVAGETDLDPAGLALDRSGNLYVADAAHDRIRRIEADPQTAVPTVLQVSLAGLGNITSTPPRIHCGDRCSAAFTKPATLQLKARPASGYRFAGWSGDCKGRGTCTVTLKASRTVTAVFESKPGRNTLSVGIVGTGAGVVVSDPAGIQCGSRCQASLPGNRIIKLKARPKRGSTFVEWVGGCPDSRPNCPCLNDPVCTWVGGGFTPSGDPARSVAARFNKTP